MHVMVWYHCNESLLSIIFFFFFFFQNWVREELVTFYGIFFSSQLNIGSGTLGCVLAAANQRSANSGPVMLVRFGWALDVWPWEDLG